MSSCNRTLVPYLPIQMVSLCNAMPDADIDYYLFHRNLTEKDWHDLEAVCQALGQIRFHPVQVREPEKYDQVAKHGKGTLWGGEAYYPLCAWEYIPETEDRLLYMDAGDIIITDTLAPYYYDSFDGKMFIVTPMRYHTRITKLATGGQIAFTLPFTEDDLESCYDLICMSPNPFNSGCYVINLERMRAEGLTMDDFLAFSRELREISGRPEDTDLWQGDQGFMSAAFLGDMKLFERPDRVDLMYLPYNFNMTYYYNERFDPDYIPAVVHFCGGDVPKPWNVPYDVPIPRFPAYPTRPGMDYWRIIPKGYPLMNKWYDLWYETAQYTDKLMTKLGL